jgi:hypothetical protein
MRVHKSRKRAGGAVPSPTTNWCSGPVGWVRMLLVSISGWPGWLPYAAAG